MEYILQTTLSLKILLEKFNTLTFGEYKKSTLHTK